MAVIDWASCMVATTTSGLNEGGYAVVGMPEMPSCDNCNRILPLTTDMRLDAELVLMRI